MVPSRAAEDLDGFEARVAELIRLRQARYEAENAWREQQRLVDARLQLLTDERAALTNDVEIARVATDEAAAAARKAVEAATAQRRKLKALLPPLLAAEARVQSLSAWLPEPLRDRLEVPLHDLDTAEAPTTPADLAERLRRLFGLLTEIEQFSHGVHLVRQRLTGPDGATREMDVLYAGLGAAFAVSLDDTLAAWGSPSRQGWTWQWDATLAADVRHVVAVFRKEKPAGFVCLPLHHVTVDGEEDQ